MSRKKGFKVKRSRRNLYKRRKSTGRKIFEGVLFVVILGALVFVGYSVASPLIKFFSGNGNTSSASEPAWTPPESVPDTSSTDDTSVNSGTETSKPDNTTSSDESKPTEVTSTYARTAAVTQSYLRSKTRQASCYINHRLKRSRTTLT